MRLQLCRRCVKTIVGCGVISSFALAIPALAGLPVSYGADLKLLKKNVHLGEPLEFSLYTALGPRS